MRPLLKNIMWWFRHFSWYLTLLAACVALSTAVASVSIKRSADASDTILHTLGVKQRSISKMMNCVDWTLTITWGLLGALIAGERLPFAQNA
jgi:hypothetical protein